MDDDVIDENVQSFGAIKCEIKTPETKCSKKDEHWTQTQHLVNIISEIELKTSKKWTHFLVYGYGVAHRCY